jgi:hypothetical protein
LDIEVPTNTRTEAVDSVLVRREPSDQMITAAYRVMRLTSHGRRFLETPRNRAVIAEMYRAMVRAADTDPAALNARIPKEPTLAMYVAGVTSLGLPSGMLKGPVLSGQNQPGFIVQFRAMVAAAVVAEPPGDT